MTNKEVFINEYLIKMSEKENYQYISKWLAVREKEIIKFEDEEVLILEPIVNDILRYESGELDVLDFVSNNINLELKEVENLPLHIFQDIRDKIISFTTSKDENLEEETIKKN